MAKKRKVGTTSGATSKSDRSRFTMEERFEDSEDDFYAGRDKILLEEAPSAKRRRRIEYQERDLQLSDEEVLGHSETDDDPGESEQTDQVHAVDSEEENDEYWGNTKADYYNADVVETEADALDEEKEAKRLQQKQLKSITEKDFGFDESMWITHEEKIGSRPIVEKLPETKIPSGASKDEQVEILSSRYPEFDLLAKDFVELQVTWIRLQRDMVTEGSKTRIGVTVQTKLTALTTYLGAIAMYFAMITSSQKRNVDQHAITAMSPPELREHAIMDNLMTARQMWNAVKNVEMPRFKENSVSKVDHIDKLDIDMPKLKQKRAKNRQFSPVSAVSNVFQTTAKPETKKRLLDLQSLLARPALPQARETPEFGDEEPLTELQAAEKARKKKSLRFYTTQIAQKANRRGAASREAGGDDDVPYKERLRDKQERLLKEAERRGQQQASGLEALGHDSDTDSLAVEDDGYYQSLVNESQRKKATKAAKAAAYAQAAKQGAQVYEEEHVGEDGKRKITYAIEKNKGLAPKRKKDVRNPRVKKRKKFDEKMKKLGSIRQVYKGGEARGGYGGELTGIKSNIVKSVKL